MSAAAFQAQSSPGAMVSAHAVVASSGEKDAVLMLDGRGMICDCNRAAESLFQYRRSELVWRSIAMLLPEWAEQELLKGGEPNPRLRFLCRIGRQFKGMTKDGNQFASELCLNLLDGKGNGRLSLIVRPLDQDNPKNITIERLDTHSQPQHFCR